MAPTRWGYWSPDTATIDWCEENYEVTSYVAEFWNTVSNLFMIVPPALGALKAYYSGLDLRIICCYLSLFVVGLGSWCFHMTLLYEMQLLDELPMIWGCAVLVYCLFDLTGHSRNINLPILLVLLTYCVIVSLVYVTVRQPVFQEVAYGILVFSILCKSIHIMRIHKCNRALFVLSTSTYLLGFFLWNVDNVYCPQLRSIRENLFRPLRPITQLHAWWHCLAGIGTCLHIIFCATTRATFLKKEISLKADHRWPFTQKAMRSVFHGE